MHSDVHIHTYVQHTHRDINTKQIDTQTQMHVHRYTSTDTPHYTDRYANTEIHTTYTHTSIRNMDQKLVGCFFEGDIYRSLITVPLKMYRKFSQLKRILVGQLLRLGQKNGQWLTVISSTEYTNTHTHTHYTHTHNI